LLLTNARHTHFSASEVPTQIERTITIRGTSVDMVGQAEQIISNKLRLAYSHELTMPTMHPQQQIAAVSICVSAHY
jgi:hypothetical protein